MFPEERRKWIEEEIQVNKKVDIEEISKRLNVSSMTIRRDLTKLESNGKVIRTHGGAISSKLLTGEKSHSSKKTKNIIEKQAIARKAVELIEENSTIILDSGTTTLEVAKLIKDRNDLTVVTNDVKIANKLVESPIKTIVMGGEIQRGVGALFGPATERILKEIYADLLFLGTHAIHIEKGITAPTFERATIKKMMMDAVESTWLLTDSSKFNQMAFSHVCQISDVDGIITDENIEKDLIEELDSKTTIYFGGDI